MAPQIEAVYTESAPAPLPQFSQAVKHNGMVYCSGNIGAIPGTNFELRGTVKERAVSSDHLCQLRKPEADFSDTQRQAIQNLEAILLASGSSLRNVVKMNIYITDMSKFALVNEAYDEFFTWEPKPVRVLPEMPRESETDE
jgi:enamine deaminase RidA (YjgF/YER057c/UK114 family)